MQTVTTSDCAAAKDFDANDSILTTYILKDSRDNNTYKIRKLADDHCWMVTNLTITNRTISKTDSDSNGSFTIPASKSGSSWINSFTAAYMHVGNTTDDGGKNWKSGMGPYYNWYTATAGQGTNTSASPEYSICPKGWKLPLGTTATYSWYYLYNTSYNKNISNFQTATNTNTFGGAYYSYYDGSLYSAGTDGHWWSRTTPSVDTSVANDLRTNSSYVSPQANSYKYNGQAIRCVFVGS